MGLTISHNAFSGSYGTFDQFRHAVLDAVGGSVPYRRESPGIAEFLEHADDAGEIAPHLALQMAEELSVLTPQFDEAYGMGGYLGAFIEGCRKAHAAGEPLEFF
jgi:hypothetical protein